MQQAQLPRAVRCRKCGRFLGGADTTFYVRCHSCKTKNHGFFTKHFGIDFRIDLWYEDDGSLKLKASIVQ